MATAYKSPNFDDRAGGAAPSMLILHYTGMESETLALERLCDPAAKVSAHYFVRENGEVLQLVEDARRAWHAGVSYWDGVTDINSHSLGIEIANPGHEFGYRVFPEAQIRAVAKLCGDIMTRYGILPARVLGHSDIAPGRKEDPGELFPWQKLAEQGIGVWSAPADMDHEAAQDITDLRDLLTAYGYNPEVAYEETLKAFHRHFYPEKFLNGKPETVDNESIIRLLALVRAAHGGKT